MPWREKPALCSAYPRGLADGVGMRMIKAVVITAVAAVVVESLPDLARYLRIRRL